MKACVLDTARCTLRPLDEADAAFILSLLNEASFLRFIGDKGVRTLSDARSYIAKGPVASYRAHGFGLLHASLRAGGAPIGICGLVKRDTLVDPDVGFAFLARHAGKGYATESAAAVLRHARHSLRLRRVVAITHLDNRGSMAVLEKIGMRFERVITLDEGGPRLRLYGDGDGDGDGDGPGSPP